MRIAYIAAGAAGMYCGSCLHDNTLAAALMAQGHDVALIPTYTPLRTDEVDVTNEPIFYGAINVFLQQKAGLFRRSPALLDRLLDRPGLLRWISRFAASTDARDLGALTLSILQAEQGYQHKELHRLLEFLGEFQPDVVQLTNAMFLGIGAAIRRQLGVPVVSGLTGEDLFLQELPEAYRSSVQTEMARSARDVDAFTATSQYYKEVMQGFLDVDEKRLHVVPLGIKLQGFEPHQRRPGSEDTITIGYLARICPEKGLHILLEAFRLLRQASNGERVRLAIAGYLSARDRAYFEEQRQALQDWGVADAVELLGEIDRPQKLEFFHRIDLLSVPTIYQEPKGLFVLEAWAAGVPVVQPSHGAFPELIETHGGGLVCQPGSAEDLAFAIQSLIDDPDRRLELGRLGRAAVEEHFNEEAMAERTAAVYEEILQQPRLAGVST